MTGGAYHRRIELSADATTVTADLEDDFHHFRVVLRHDGRRVVAVSGEALRFPWSACGQAPDELAALSGAPLSRRSTAIGEHLVARHNCTHLFDLAGLALAHAAAGRATRRYDVRVPDRIEGRTHPTLQRDGRTLLAWDVEHFTVLGPPPFGGRSLRAGFLAWAEEALGTDTAEAAIVLRRACMIAYGRDTDLDRLDHAGQLLPLMSGTCFTFQPDRAPTATRMKGSTRPGLGIEPRQA